ncbi:BlaI/MecI/CopY family transcriptional regulator [Alkaliphilus peptidifermentans]|uniref:BlaI family transcriptional regulator, penicillinase repressor n=1 Tax=Alkaliphilus peptidifermentans DSM 18978 TaxID=1120976 RepID=A0A1G5HP75_9FIRM|nr:BlaI/MecI/CopY family transcriptional regulator [Alkaliphilus peptidifermentans]SCY65120.1 BlaI family transcriptional regulator, penicillinase repressor [Alkaliphilus peptidifermentans DSM 18978]
MNENISKISDAEWKVMEVVWKEHPVTAAEIIDELIVKTDWNRKTIHTLIRRLVQKKVLGITEENPYVYYPLIEEEFCKKEETKSFLEKVYNGSLQLLMSNFLKNENLSKEEINQLKKILDECQDRGDKK